MRPWTLILAVLVGLGLAWPGDAQEHRRERDFELMRRAVERGEALPLAEILARVRGSLPGEIVAVEIERQGGLWIYELKVVDAAGRRREIRVDARTGEIHRGEHR